MNLNTGTIPKIRVFHLLRFSTERVRVQKKNEKIEVEEEEKSLKVIVGRRKYEKERLEIK